MQEFIIDVRTRQPVKPEDAPADSKLGQARAMSKDADAQWKEVATKYRGMRRDLTALREQLADAATMTVDEIVKTGAQAAILEAQFRPVEAEYNRLKNTHGDLYLRRTQHDYSALIEHWNALTDLDRRQSLKTLREWRKDLTDTANAIREYDGGASLQAAYATPGEV